MTGVNVWCPRCTAVRLHVADNSLTYCTGCKARTDLGEGLAVAALAVAELPVEDMRDCRWCNEIKAVGHDCPAGAVGCENNPPDGPTCGRCGPCCRAQAQTLAARDAEFKADPFGSPSDIDFP